jgi:hypothetical protein
MGINDLSPMKYRVTIKLTGPPSLHRGKTVRNWLGSIHRWIWQWSVSVPVGEWR